jgi:hypothetical protein
MGVGGQRQAPAYRHGTHCTGSWVGPGPFWTDSENLTNIGFRTPDCPARSESLYRLSYPLFYVLLTVHPCIIFYIKPTSCTIFLACLFLFSTSFRRLCFIPPCIPDSRPHSVTNTTCRIDTVFSPDYGHIVARNM